MNKLAKSLGKRASTSSTMEAVYLCYLPVRIGDRSFPISSTKTSPGPCYCHTQSYTERIALDGDLDEYSNTEKPVSDNLGDSLPEPLDFVFDKPLSVSNVSETLGFGDERDIQNGGKS